MMATTAQRNAAFTAVYALILAKIKSEVPGMFEGTAESALPQHKQDVLDLSNAALDAADGVNT